MADPARPAKRVRIEITPELRARAEHNRQIALERLQHQRQAAQPPPQPEWIPLHERVAALVASTLASLGPDVTRLIAQYLTYYDDAIGIIVHWGVYSVPAYDHVVLAEHRLIQNGSEWYAHRLHQHANSTGNDTQRHHARVYGRTTPYKAFADSFSARQLQLDTWMKAFKDAGASYAILTTKHHDGFCLWPTKTTTFSTAHAATAQHGHANLVQEFKDACARWGLRFGVYYSWWEFYVPPTQEYLRTVVWPQIKELARFKPDLFWFDGDWPLHSTQAGNVMLGCVRYLKLHLPRVQINDRIGCKSERKDANYLGLSTYRVYADRAIPSTPPRVPWEHVNTIGLSWGYNRQQEAHNYKSGVQLLQLYQRTRAANGRFLLNVGPDADGRICDHELDRVCAFARLLPQ